MNVNVAILIIIITLLTNVLMEVVFQRLDRLNVPTLTKYL